jgi:hypothetical protein
LPLRDSSKHRAGACQYQERYGRICIYSFQKTPPLLA